MPTSSRDESKSSARYLKLLEMSEVLKRIHGLSRVFEIRDAEYLQADKALGRIAAEEIRSPCDIPARDISAMDGYAIRSCDTQKASLSNPVHFKVKGVLHPHSSFPSSLANQLRRDIPNIKKGEAYQVATGAPIPLYGDSVVRVEEVRNEDGQILVRRRSPKWKNVSARGEDVRRGDIILRERRILNPSDIALLIGAGLRRVRTFALPRIGILSVGNELIEFDDSKGWDFNSRNGITVNNYSNLLCGYVQALGAHPVPLGIAKDDSSEICGLITKALQSCDMVITIAGSSVGKRDLTTEAISSIERSTILFHGVRLVPIRPAGLALVGSKRVKPVAIIPGHAVSATLAFFVIALPVINMLMGLEPDSRNSFVGANLDMSLTNERGIDALYLVSLKVAKNSASESYIASPVAWGSNVISNLSRSNGFVQLAAHETLHKGDVVRVNLFGAKEIERVCSSSPSSYQL